MNVLLADDHNIVRQGMEILVDEIIENCSFFHASSLHQINYIISENDIDLAVIDAQYPDGNCLQAIKRLKQLHPEAKILVFSGFEEEIYALKFIKEGADGFLSKLSDEADIRNAISQMISTGHYYSALTQSLLNLSKYNPGILNPLNQLSERELEIAELLTKGMGNLEIANSLEIRQNTVSTYKKRIFEKLNITTLVDLIDLFSTYKSL